MANIQSATLRGNPSVFLQQDLLLGVSNTTPLSQNLALSRLIMIVIACCCALTWHLH